MMKYCRIFLLMLLCCCLIPLWADEVKVILKNGTTLTGELKELVATDHVTIEVAGVESVIPMNKVASIEKTGSGSNTSSNEETSSELVYGKYEITDTKAYPESFILKIGNQELTMILVRGGWFNMGYDDRHSLSWDSEPVHKVTLSSYYVSNQYLNCHAVETLLKKKKATNSIKPYNCKSRKDVEKLVDEISRLSNAPFRLLTEAEWEYAALMPFARTIFDNKKKVEWCFDFFEKYPTADQINPQGPRTGKNHVLRSYSSENEKWKRIQGFGKNEQAWTDAYIRIAISADQIKQ